jgi:hypothetical protein
MGCGGTSALVGLFGCQGNTYITNVYEMTPEAGKDGAVESSADSSGNDAGVPDAMAPDGPESAPDASVACDASTDVCMPICGDGLMRGPDGMCSQRDTACDMTGYWAARETSHTQDTVIGSIQTSSAWSLFHFQQTGNDFHIVEVLDCGTHVTGSATMDFTQAAFVVNMYLNRQDGVADDAGVVHAARHGTSQQVAGGCAVTLDRWYKLRGATDDYLPADFTTNPPLSSLKPLPTVMSYMPNSTEWPMGATDPDGDGIPGIAYQISGLISATRNAVEREWRGYATPAGSPVPASAVTIVVPDGYDDQESLMRVTGCANTAACTLAAAGSVIPQNHPGHITLAFIGKTFGSSSVAPVVAGVPRQSAGFDQMTCANVRLLLPHVPCPDPCASDAGLSSD